MYICVCVCVCVGVRLHCLQSRWQKQVRSSYMLFWYKRENTDLLTVAATST